MSTSIDTGAAEVALAEVKAGETRSLHPRSVDETAVSAHHEAAHVVLAFRHGLRTPSVSIAPQEGSYGRTDCHFELGPCRGNDQGCLCRLFGGSAPQSKRPSARIRLRC